jgi:hypothetical protein
MDLGQLNPNTFSRFLALPRRKASQCHLRLTTAVDNRGSQAPSKCLNLAPGYQEAFFGKENLKAMQIKPL